jgi:hypothetical protein
MCWILAKERWTFLRTKLLRPPFPLCPPNDARLDDSTEAKAVNLERLF